jgi:hypothetical protein
MICRSNLQITRKGDGEIKKYFIGQKIIWHCKDFESDKYVKAVITEVDTDHCLAVSKDNDSAMNDLTLWIDEDTEIDVLIRN